MMLKNVATEQAITALATNMVNAANLTWNNSNQRMLPLRWGAAHRAVMQTLRSTLDIKNRQPLPSVVNEVARQVVDAVEWGNHGYQQATDEELTTIVHFLTKELPAWLKEHLITSMLEYRLVEKNPSRVKSVRAVNSLQLWSTLEGVNPSLFQVLDNGTWCFTAKQVSQEVKVITPDIMINSVPLVRYIHDPQTRYALKLRKELEASEKLLILSNNLEHRTVPCLLARDSKSGKHSHWVIFNMPTHNYVHRLKLRLPLNQEKE